MRLIDGDKLKEDGNEWLSYDYKTRVDLTAVKIPNKWLNALIKCIDNQPTVDVLEQIRAEIYEEFMTIDGGVHDESAIKCMEIIDKYRGNKE